MIPLNYATLGEDNIIKKVGGNPDVKQHLQNLGFVVGETVQVITSLNGNLIVSVKGVRVAVSKELAQKVMI